MFQHKAACTMAELRLFATVKRNFKKKIEILGLNNKTALNFIVQE